MKRILAFALSFALLLTSCGQSPRQESPAPETPTPIESEQNSEPSPVVTESPVASVPEYQNLNDPELLRYVEDNIYQELVTSLNSSDYFVENVSATYISKEYLEELSYNSKENIFFGYTLSELDEQFQGTRYVFTLGDNGETTVVPFEKNADSYEQILKNVVIGSGVILVCITVSTVSAGLGASAVSMIFSMSAKVGTTAALSSGAFGGISAGILTGVQTGNFDAAMEAAALGASEGFKWGAISGAINGGVTEAIALKGAALHGLSMNEAAKIQQEDKLPLSLIKNFHSTAEYDVYKSENLAFIDTLGKNGGYVQQIDWEFIGDISDGRTNAQRVLDGLSPLDPTGMPYDLHHIGQKADSPLAILTNSTHHGNYSTLHANTGANTSEIDRIAFEKEKDEFWLQYLKLTWEGFGK